LSPAWRGRGPLCGQGSTRPLSTACLQVWLAESSPLEGRGRIQGAVLPTRPYPRGETCFSRLSGDDAMSTSQEVRPVGTAKLLDVNAVAEILSCSPRHVYRLSDAGKMPRPVKLGALVRWPLAQIEEWIAQSCPAGRPPGPRKQSRGERPGRIRHKDSARQAA